MLTPEEVGKYRIFNGNPEGLFGLWYHGRVQKSDNKQVGIKRPFCASAEDGIPNEINVFESYGFCKGDGIGITLDEAIYSAFNNLKKTITPKNIHL